MRRQRGTINSQRQFSALCISHPLLPPTVIRVMPPRGLVSGGLDALTLLKLASEIPQDSFSALRDAASIALSVIETMTVRFNACCRLPCAHGSPLSREDLGIDYYQREVEEEVQGGLCKLRPRRQNSFDKCHAISWVSGSPGEGRCYGEDERIA